MITLMFYSYSPTDKIHMWIHSTFHIIGRDKRTVFYDHVLSTKLQISLHIKIVRKPSSMATWRSFVSMATYTVHNEYSAQTAVNAQADLSLC